VNAIDERATLVDVYASRGLPKPVRRIAFNGRATIHVKLMNGHFCYKASVSWPALQGLEPRGVASGVLIGLHNALANLVVALYGFHAMRERTTGPEVFQDRRQETKGSPANARETIDFPRELRESLVAVADEIFRFPKVVAQDLREHCLVSFVICAEL